MRMNYTTPEMEIVLFTDVDVITLSLGTGQGNEGGEYGVNSASF